MSTWPIPCNAACKMHSAGSHVSSSQAFASPTADPANQETSAVCSARKQHRRCLQYRLRDLEPSRGTATCSPLDPTTARIASAKPNPRSSKACWKPQFRPSTSTIASGASFARSKQTEPSPTPRLKTAPKTMLSSLQFRPLTTSLWSPSRQSYRSIRPC